MPSHFSIDVEAVATGTDHNSRAVAQISLVDEYEQVILNLYVKPPVPVVSYLHALTGLTREVLDQYGMPLEQALSILRAHLPKSAVIVGQNIRKDIEWLGLKEQVDYDSLIDLVSQQQRMDVGQGHASYWPHGACMCNVHGGCTACHAAATPPACVPCS